MSVNFALENGEPYQSKTKLPLLIFFSLCLTPILFNGISLNYFFVVFPVFIILSKGRIIKPTISIILGLIIFSLIFVLATLYQINQVDLFIRRLSSFLIFMSLFSYSIININNRTMLAFKMAIVIVSAVFSLESIVSFFDVQMSSNIKEGVGSTRFGFIYLMAFWILLFDLKEKKITTKKIFTTICLIIVTIGIFLTFSRSSIVAFLASLFLFSLIHFFNSIRKLNIKAFMKIIFGILAMFITLMLIQEYMPFVFEYYMRSLINPLLDSNLYQSIFIPNSSEGIRLIRLLEVIDFVSLNPFTGSGYLGVWTVSVTGSGSTHGQLSDVLLRVGFFGFALYLYFGICLLWFLWRYYKSFFWGLLSVLIYGFFHETFKEPHGAFILAFLFGVYSQHLRKKKIAYLNKQSKYLNS
jgi:hypothetical protein